MSTCPLWTWRSHETHMGMFSVVLHFLPLLSPPQPPPSVSFCWCILGNSTHRCGLQMPDSWYADLPAQFCSVPTYWFGRPHCRTPLNSACVLGSVCGAEPLTTQLHVAIDISRQNSKPVRHAHRRWRLSPTHFTFTGRSIHRTKPPRIVSCTLPVARTPLCLDDPICLLLLLPGPGRVQTCSPFPFVCLCGSPCPVRPFRHPSACFGLSVTVSSTVVTMPVEPDSAFPIALRIRHLRAGSPSALPFPVPLPFVRASIAPAKATKPKQVR